MSTPVSAWRGYRRADFPVASWTVEGDTLRALGGAAPVSLISRQRYADFDLSLEWRLLPGGNSGILYKVTEERAEPWQSGPEMQLLGGVSHPDAQVPETSCGALYGLFPPQATPPCAPGLFNIARISVRGSRVEHWLNGVRTLASDLRAPEFAARVKSSKFAGFPAFATAASGHIVLQHHGSDAWFRDIRIEGA